MQRGDYSQLGLHGFTLQDLAFLQTGYNFGFEALASAFGNCILSGIAVTSTEASGVYTISATAGYIIINNEIVQFDAQSITGLTALEALSVKVKIVEAVIAPAPVPYQDATMKDVYFSRKAVLDKTTGTAFFSIKSIDAILRDKVLTAPAPTALTLSSEWENGENPVPNPSAIIRGRTVSLFGDIRYKSTSPSTPTIVFAAQANGAIPPPLYNIVQPAMACNYDTLTNKPINMELTWIRIDTAGNIYLPHDTGKSILLDVSYPF